MSVTQISPRFFAPNQSLKEQIAILNDLIKTTKQNDPARVHLITPTLAEYVLNNKHGANRSVSAKKVSEYNDAMADNRWPVTGATIVFGKHGRLLDGQHRLIACARSGVPFMCYVVFGVDESAFTLIDIGRRRTNIHAFQIAGVANASLAAKATRWLMIFENDPTNRSVVYTNEEALEWYNDHVDTEMLNETIKMSSDIERTSRARGESYAAGALSALLYLFGKKNKRDMLTFAENMRLAKGNAKTLFSEIARARSQSGGTINEIYRNALTIMTWNAFRQSKRINRSSLVFTALDKFPEIV